MLSERETRSLLDIEQQLMRRDARFVALMDTSVFDRRERRTRCAYDAVVALAALAGVICVALADSGTFGAGMAALGLGAVTAGLRIQRFPIRRRSHDRRS